MLKNIYHFLLSLGSAIFYRFPSRQLFVVGIVGTKGKTSTAEIISAILEESGYKTAISSTLRFKIGEGSEKNETKMTMPGRFFLQKFLHQAVKENCRYAILEMTSQGALQHRHRFIDMDALIFTNLAPEHIEAHGSFGEYKQAKLAIFKQLEKSKKKEKIIIANGDDPNANDFLDFKVERKIKYSLNSLADYKVKKEGLSLETDGIKISSPLCGEFNLYNLLSAIAFAKTQDVGLEIIKSAIEKFSGIEGRMEEIDASQDFRVIVDYAHTPDSLEKVYEFFQTSRKICVLGSAGGGRDKWKRAEMGKIADKYCDQIILTNEDSYDENPGRILAEINLGMNSDQEAGNKTEIILDRREAIAKALGYAKTGDVVLITGKGAEPWMMGPKGTKISWDDRAVTKEELKKLLAKK